MPTATSTLTKTVRSAPSTLKAAVFAKDGSSSTPSSTTGATLRTLYNRAAHAFLHRDIPLTQSLIESAFAVIDPPTVIPDALTEHRRKWDILRITLESTIYSSPPSRPDVLPESLRHNLVESPPSLITKIYARSLALFTPISGIPAAAYLPPQVLITLIYASLRIESPDAGRTIVEDWLSRRDNSLPIVDLATPPEDIKKNGYEKVLELYCLQILPKLEQWDYAQEFLEYEGELSHASRENFKNSLRSSRAETVSSRQLLHNTLTPASPAFRPHSPAMSSSSSSSVSTTSTHTIVPLKPRGPPGSISSSVTPLTQTSTSTTSTTLLPPDPSTTAPQPTKHPAYKSIPFAPMTSPSRSHSEALTVHPENSSVYALVKASVARYMTTPNVTTFFLLFVVFPLFSFIIRARHRRRKALASGGISVASNVEVVRRRLQASDVGLLGRAWGEVVRVVSDTVKMAGSGLV